MRIIALLLCLGLCGCGKSIDTIVITSEMRKEHAVQEKIYEYEIEQEALKRIMGKI